MQFSNILVNIDFNQNNSQLIKFGFELAKLTDSQLIFLHCYHPGPTDRNMETDELDKNHLFQLISLVEPIAAGYHQVEQICDVMQSLVGDSISEYMSQENCELLILREQGNEAIALSKSIDLPVIIVPEDHRQIDIDHLVFIVEFEFREIHKILELLIMCENIGAYLSCIHISRSQDVQEARKNMRIYHELFQDRIDRESIGFDIIEEEKGTEVKDFVMDNEADLLVLCKSRKTWKNIYKKTLEEKLGQNIPIPILLMNL